MKALWMLCLGGLAACSKSEKMTNCVPGSKSYTYQANKSLDTTTSSDVAIAAGSKTVFQYQDNFERCSGQVGAAVARALYFEIPSTVQSDFSYADSASLAGANALYYLNAPINTMLRRKRVRQGTIQGIRTSQLVWHVKGSVTVDGENMAFEADFVRVD